MALTSSGRALRINSNIMNAGGTTFWVALLVAASLACGSTWLFLSPAASAETVKEQAKPAEQAATASELGTAVVAETAADEVEADVTFSFAKEVVRFADGDYLEQDDLFRLTCRDKDRGALWEREMDAPILSAVKVDANDDGPQEFLLVDSRQGIGLDPGGLPIPGFAIRPNAPITSFALVDYEGDGRERYLFGLADGRILNHRNLGEPTPGWRHTSKGAAIQVIAHLRTGRKDYLCTVDEAGMVMLLKRNGQRRVRTPVQLHRTSGQRVVAFDIRSDITGSTIISRNADGAVESRKFGDGIPLPASAAEVQLLITEEARAFPAAQEP